MHTWYRVGSMCQAAVAEGTSDACLRVTRAARCMLRSPGVRCRSIHRSRGVRAAPHDHHPAGAHQFTAFTRPCGAAELYTTYAQEVAQILRLAHVALSEQEVHDAISQRIAFGLDDVAIIDWHAALLFDREADDVCAVLTFANVELLEMRYLDEQLDKAMNQAYEVLSKRTWNWLRPGSTAADLHHVAQMQVESAMLFEGVNNALKLVGDQYLARLYRLASQRFHLEEWDASIIRKLHTLESIYEKISDRATTQRMEILEWIIIILIAVSIVLPFIAGLPQH